MNILIIGRGGREHAMAWKVAQSPLVTNVFVAPGNDGIAESFECVNINETDTENLIQFAKENNIHLTIVGPEVALMNGIVDEFQKHNLKIFGPLVAAAQIEGSKQFAKELMHKYHIPTAAFEVFENYNAAKQYLLAKGAPIVIKYDGLAAGKGVVVAMTIEEADQALQDMLLNDKFGKGKVVIEEFLSGPEFSLMAFVHGETILPLAIAQDHKRAFDGDQGPNTGGMGAYTPVSIVPNVAIEEAITTVMQPTAKAMVANGTPFTGILYGGLILTKEGPKVIEFNARFGDPETEVVLPKMKSDMIEVIMALLNGKTPEIEWYENAFLGVVLASKGYPEAFEKGVEIEGLKDRRIEGLNTLVFHCGTAKKEGKWVNNGGRVLFVVGEGKTLADARKNAYQTVENLSSSENLFYRTDIGWQSL
ncbi:MAG: phosphoribosylamine--glycine ligase [Bacteroidetes bacterium]|nr:phosphoribosylamine--glycine ligase [Bacteroidota bacterium]MCL2302398.1 phosphoribosylamine--glycine ligase [Lentimicrobiaceae bacterium]